MRDKGTKRMRNEWVRETYRCKRVKWGGCEKQCVGDEANIWGAECEERSSIKQRYTGKGCKDDLTYLVPVRSEVGK